MVSRVHLLALSLAATACGNPAVERASVDHADNRAAASVAPAPAAAARTPAPASAPGDPRVTAAAIARYDRRLVPAEITTVDETRGVTCAAYLARQIESLAPAEQAPLIAAMRVWRGEAERVMGRDAAARFSDAASAILGEAPTAEVRAGAGYCLVRTPRNR